MKKLIEYSDKEREVIKAEIENTGDLINERQNSSKFLKMDHDFGICNNCKNFMFAEIEHGGIRAFCESWEINRNSQKRVIKCNQFSEVGTLSLWDMKEMAYIIELDNEIGFIKSENNGKKET